jgi:carbon-monoxide dehydrogenase small subunit/isoquinoline 1-oxidoreductase alpha subunit/xanthine dehydrogenase YagT iron-sulfur-binding subunit
MEGEAGANVVGESLEVSFVLNGRATTVRARTHHTIVDVLRDQKHLYGVREGCGVGMCGACTVLVDGEPQSGCLILAVSAEGREITTVEGLEDASGELSDIQDAFIRHTAFQCSYCTSGFLLATKRLLEELPDASPHQVKTYLAGNLCRCGSYMKILDAVMDLLERRRTVGLAPSTEDA